ncbi:MAG: gliding motility-associated C-terminal domain-containing protein, partial [Bacteroidota bacterium]
GAVTHAGPDNLAGPTQADAINGNIETCRFLPLRVTWDAPSQTMRVYFNCDLRLEYTGDIINDIFGGDPFVFYGFAAATGGLVNRQEVCFRFNSFLKALEDVTMCPGAQVLLDVAGGARTQWSPAAGLDDPTASNVIASPDTTTTYIVNIFDNCDIPIRDTVTITVAGDSAFVDLGPDTTICPQNALIFDVTTPTAIYEWSDPSLMGPVVSIAQAGTYDVTVTRQDIICEASDRVMIENHPIPELDLGPPDTSICQGELLKIFPSNDIGQPILDVDGGIPFDTLYLSRPGRYRAFIDDPCGVIFDQIDLEFVDCQKIYLPNAFSPNGDGINDRFFPQDGGDVVIVHLLMIYDRWGEQVYRAAELPTNVAGLGWDGRLNGRPLNPGTYVWYLEATFKNGVRDSRRGEVVLVR